MPFGQWCWNAGKLLYIYTSCLFLQLFHISINSVNNVARRCLLASCRALRCGQIRKALLWFCYVFVYYSDSSGRRSSWRRLWSLCTLAWLISRVRCRVLLWSWRPSMTDSRGEWELHIFPDELAADLSLYWPGCFESRPSVLDNFALLSGQLNTINKVLKNEKTPSYRSQVIIPLLLSPDRDEELLVSVFTDSLWWWHRNWVFKVRAFLLWQRLTEQRVPVFSHEIVPDHLRTKPDPEVEEQEKHLSAEAARIGPEVAQVNKSTMALY